MPAAQRGLCAICRTAPAAHVDHDHKTGDVRALLCFNCNGGLGQFRDDPVVLRAAADYVEAHARRSTTPTRLDGLRVWRLRHQDLLTDRISAEFVAMLPEA